MIRATRQHFGFEETRPRDVFSCDRMQFGGLASHALLDDRSVGPAHHVGGSSKNQRWQRAEKALDCLLCTLVCLRALCPCCQASRLWQDGEQVLEAGFNVLELCPRALSRIIPLSRVATGSTDQGNIQATLFLVPSQLFRQEGPGTCWPCEPEWRTNLMGLQRRPGHRGPGPMGSSYEGLLANEDLDESTQGHDHPRHEEREGEA
mmetsp:Transcript_7159/g.15542  ORF Transcript_7159/g.15542 Transcript_7159/m.15542 type:complete len:205 (+) Transcript_7159:836-1450(+)